ncbi:serine acetyltransferase [Pseudacidovorax intermedius]|uniref:serine acetyltransferase n=1 Tax=Pseudacidovorax intermedius TaxID=433924 RepID=UPI0026EFE3B5|nr:serine acetyltransferase [Pseudacidovorax intermedius]
MKAKTLVASFRVAQLYYHLEYPIRFLFFPALLFYYFVFDFLMGVEIKAKTRIGWGLRIFHPVGIIINTDTVIGCRCTLRHNVTIGNKPSSLASGHSASPLIGDDVEFGAGAIVIGPIVIGNRARIGAHAYVDFNVPEDKTVFAHRSQLRV